MINALSENSKRNKSYVRFLDSCRKGEKTVEDIIALGSKLMRKASLHHHFFQDLSLKTTAFHLAQFALKPAVKNLDDKLTELEAEQILKVFEKRIAMRIPVEYITHEADYLGYSFYVNENVLVPRSLMNTRFEDFLRNISWENYRVLDLCTGCGCIGITLALLKPELIVDLADISSLALEVAQENINRYSLNERVKCIQTDVFENIQGPYDLIITNPPYVPKREYESSPKEFKSEPKIALEAGKTGLDIINKIILQAKNYLNPNGVLIAEVGFTTAKRIKKAFPCVPFKWFKYRRPSGKESWLGMHGVFLCEQKDLP